MAGMNSIGVGGMTFNQYQNATMSTAALASQTTGTAKQQSASMQENHSNRDGVTLSDKAALSLKDDSNEMQEEQLKQEQQESKKSDNQETKLQQQRLNQSSGHAAMSLGSKSKDSEKTENKQGHQISNAKPGEGSNIVRDDIQREEDLNQAAALGLLQEEAKKQLKTKQDEKDAMRQINMFSKEHTGGASSENASNKIQSDENIKIDQVKAEDINRVMNRTPEEILADVPQQFRATAQIMVAGQVDAVGQPKEALTQMKREPRVESAMMELMPAESIGEIEVAEQNSEPMQMAFEGL